MFIIYKTDNWHSYASRDLIGVAENKSMAMRLCKEQSLKEGFILDKDQLFNLSNLNQTQGYEGTGELNFEEVETNKLL